MINPNPFLSPNFIPTSVGTCKRPCNSKSPKNKGVCVNYHVPTISGSHTHTERERECIPDPFPTQTNAWTLTAHVEKPLTLNQGVPSKTQTKTNRRGRSSSMKVTVWLEWMSVKVESHCRKVFRAPKSSFENRAYCIFQCCCLFLVWTPRPLPLTPPLCSEPLLSELK